LELHVYIIYRFESPGHALTVDCSLHTYITYYGLVPNGHHQTYKWGSWCTTAWGSQAPQVVVTLPGMLVIVITNACGAW